MLPASARARRTRIAVHVQCQCPSTWQSFYIPANIDLGLTKVHVSSTLVMRRKASFGRSLQESVVGLAVTVLVLMVDSYHGFMGNDGSEVSSC